MKIDTNIAPPVLVQIASIVRELKRGESVLLHGNTASIRTVVSRLRRQYPFRAFQTASDKKGIRVWRTG